MTLKTENVHKSLDFLDLGVLKNWQLQQLSSDPATTYARVYQRTTDGAVRSYNAFTSAWETIGSGGGLTQEQVEDIVAALLVAGNNIDITYNDGTPSLTIDVETLTPADVSLGNVTNDAQLKAADLDTDGTLAANSNTKIPSQQAVKTYIDLARSGLDLKQSVRAATTVAGTLATSFENGDTIDGVTLATGDRILIKDQAAGAENGIYTVNASGAPTRATDADTSAEVTAGMATFVSEGTANGDHRFVLITNDAIVLGTTALVFTDDSGIAQIIAGAGLTKTGNSLAVGAGTGITVNADDVAIDPAVVARKFSADIGDNATADIVVTHNLNTRDVVVSVRTAASPYDAHDVYWEATSVNTITVFFPTAPTTAELRVTVLA